MPEGFEILRLYAARPMVYGVREVAVKVINKYINMFMNKIL